MRQWQTVALLMVVAGLLAACTQSPAGLERAAIPAHAAGEGVPGSSSGVAPAPPVATRPAMRRGPTQRTTPSPAVPAAVHQHSH